MTNRDEQGFTESERLAAYSYRKGMDEGMRLERERVRAAIEAIPIARPSAIFPSDRELVESAARAWVAFWSRTDGGAEAAYDVGDFYNCEPDERDQWIAVVEAVRDA